MKNLYLIAVAIFVCHFSHAQVKIGATNYSTLGAAVNAINGGTHTGAITVLITGNTTENAQVSLLASGTGGANYSSVTINPSGGAARSIVFSQTVHSLILNNASNVTIDGLNANGNSLTIAHSVVNLPTIGILDGASNITITKCNILGSGAVGVVQLENDDLSNRTMHHISILSCNIGPYDGNLPVSGLYFDSYYGKLTDLLIQDNNIYDFSSATQLSYGVYIGDNVPSFQVQYNRFYQTAARTVLQNFAINVVNTTFADGSGKYILNNEIGGANNQGVGIYTINGKFSGISYYVAASDEGQINNNSIKNIAVLGSSGSTGIDSPLFGIHVKRGKVQIKGNTIGSMAATGSITLTSASASTIDVFAIRKAFRGDSDISNNSIGGISVSTLTNAAMNIKGIYVQNGDNSVPQCTCTSNIIGGAVANSIICNSTASNSGMVGIHTDWIDANINGNTIRNLTGYGAGIFSSTPIGVMGIVVEDPTGGAEHTISDNVVHTLTNGNTSGMSYVGGIYRYTSDAGNVQRNFVHSLQLQSSNNSSVMEGIRCGGLAADLYNNMVALGNTTNKAVIIYGIRTTFSNSGSNAVINNSIYIGGSPTSGNANSTAFAQEVSLNTFNHIDNNIFVNNRSNNGATGVHSSIRSTNTQYNPIFYANVYYGTGNGYVLGYAGATPKTTLTAWNDWSHPNSDYGFFCDPKFIDPTGATPNLHIKTNVNTIVEGHAYVVTPLLVEDFDNQVRSSFTPNDIGADAGNFIQLTAPVITSLNVPTPFCMNGPALTIYGGSLMEVTEFKIGNTVLPIQNLIDLGNNQHVLVVYPTIASSGQITLTNPIGSLTTPESITVHALPTITTQPQSKTICQSQTTTFNVTATGGQSYQWRRNGIPIGNGGAFNNATTATLTVTNPAVSDAGTIDVIVGGTSQSCTIASNAVTLTVSGGSIELAASGPVNVCAGGSVTLSPLVSQPALQFDGVNDYVTFSSGQYYENLTMSFWIKTSQVAPTGMQWYNGAGIIDGRTESTSPNFGVALLGNKLAFGTNNLSWNSDAYTLFSNTAVNTGQWTNVIITRVSNTTEIKIYINGVLDASGTSNMGGYSFQNGEMRVGSLLSGSGFFNGAIDDIRLWNRTLSTPEIQALQINGTVNTQLLQENYQLDENSGITAFNGVFGNTAYLQNGVQWIPRLAPVSFQNYSWSNGQTTRALTVTQTGNYTLSGNNGGCSSVSNIVQVNVGNPQIFVQRDASFYCGSQPVTLTAEGADTYTWSPAAGLSATTGTIVQASPSVNTFYTVTGTTINGCQSTTQVFVPVQVPTPLTVTSNRVYIMSGETATLTASGGIGGYNWSPATGLNTTFGDAVQASPTQTITYTVAGVGCEIPQTYTVTVLPAQSATDNALDFDGIDDYVKMPVQSQAVTGTFAVSVWVKPTHPTKQMHIFSTRNGGSQLNNFDIQLMGGNKIHADIGNGTSWLTTAADATYLYQPNQWMHISYKVKPGEYKIFVNGNLVQTGNYPGSAVLYNNTTNYITIGKNDGDNSFFQGTIDDLMISNFDIPEEIMSHVPVNGLPAFARYEFNEGIAGGSNPGVTILTNDNVESTLHGTLHNFALTGTTSNWVEGQITQPQTIAFNAIVDKVYGSPDFILTATASSGLPVTYTIDNPNVATVNGNVVTIQGAGIAFIHANQDGNAFYMPSPPAFQMLTVTPKQLTIANAAVSNKTYNRNTAAAITGTLSGTVGSDIVTLNGTGTFASFNVANGIAVTSTATLAGAQSGNYTLTQPTGLSANITPKTLSITSATANNKVYNGSAAATINGTLSGIIAPDVVNIASNAGTFASANVGNNIAVTAQMTLGGAASGNYALAQPTGLTANITPTTASATISGSATICSGSSTALQINITGGTGTFTVVYTNGTLNFTINNYTSGNNIIITPTATKTYTLVSVSNANYTVTAGGSAVVTVNPLISYMPDLDGDGYGNFSNRVDTCVAPPGYVTLAGDCNDNNAAVHPGAPEICDGIDNDCDNYIDANDNDAVGLIQYYIDQDQDGVPINATYRACPDPDGITTPFAFDCADNNPNIYPGAPEICDGIDNNCDGYIDSEDSGLVGGQIYYLDFDGDGFGRALFRRWCSPPAGWVSNNTDCDDDNALVYQSATLYIDNDNDGYTNGSAIICYGTTIPPGYKLTSSGADCIDNSAAVHPGAVEICDGIDNNCDGNTDEGVLPICQNGGVVVNCGCDCPPGFSGSNCEIATDNDGDGVPNAADCAPNDPTMHTVYQFYTDNDADGYGAGSLITVCAVNATTPPANHSMNNLDCDDSKSMIHPNAIEIGYNLTDDDCDGTVDEGFVPIQTVVQGPMCNSTLATIDSQIMANIVAGAQGYRWRITTMTGPSAGQLQLLDTSLRVMKLTQLVNYAFNTQYKVEISVRYAGFWQPFTASGCTVTTPATTTVLSSCGQTLYGMSDVIYANLVPHASGYRFRITDPMNAMSIQVIERNIREFRMNLITSFQVQYGKQYNVEVSVKNTDGSWLPYGSICSVTTPLFPTASLQDAQCDDYMVPTNVTQIYANSFPNAIAYVFQLSGGGLAAPLEVTKSTRTFMFNDFAGQLTPGTTYNVRVRLVFNMADVPGPFGKACTIVTPGLSRQVSIKADIPLDVMAHPNPFSENFNIDVMTASTEAIQIKVYDITGRLLDERYFKAGTVISAIGDGYPSGVYNVTVTQGENAKTIRVIKR
jgi:hypothetical protein